MTNIQRLQIELTYPNSNELINNIVDCLIPLEWINVENKHIHLKFIGFYNYILYLNYYDKKYI